MSFRPPSPRPTSPGSERDDASPEVPFVIRYALGGFYDATITIDTAARFPPVFSPVNTIDFIVIGSGPAGRRAAIQAAKLGRSVLVVEKGRRVGGVSVHTGTIPSKTLRETVLNLTGWRERGFYGRAYRVKKDIAAKDLMARLHMTLDHEVDVLEHQFARNSVQTTLGTARFIDPHRIEVTTDAGDIRVFQGERILIAVGTRPHRPDGVPFNGTSVFDSDEIVDIPRLPRSLTVIGAGVIGVEYATIFSALDVAVALVEQRPSMLDFIDHELMEDFTHQLRDRGVALRFGAKVERTSSITTGRSRSWKAVAVCAPRWCCTPPVVSARPTRSIWTVAG
jgi:NAD(P) transhydrogenase